MGMGITTTHRLNSLQDTNSFPAFRWQAECECGFHTSMPTKEAALGQLANHLTSKGITPDKDSMAGYSLVEGETSEKVQKVETKQQVWKPNKGMDVSNQPVADVPIQQENAAPKRIFGGGV